MALLIDFCGERTVAKADGWTSIGREGDVVIDDNPYLHRQFLQVGRTEGLWWLMNVGDQLAATVTDTAGSVQAWLAPGARLPLVFDSTVVRFTAGPTSYELELVLDEPLFAEPVALTKDAGDTTIGLVPLTVDQRRLIVALAEPLLRQNGRGSAAVPSSAEAARRLGWATTRFNRKLDNVCQKLTKVGVRGLHGSPGELASNRRARLVEYAVSTRLVTLDDLPLLDSEGPLEIGDPIE